MDLKIFNKSAGVIFDEVLAKYEFELNQEKVEEFYSERIYVNEDRYVNVSAGNHPRDFPPSYNILLGQGGFEWPERDWNSIALWRIKEQVDPKGKSKEYSLEIIDEEKLIHSLSHARTELLTYGREFLLGDILLFDKVRRQLNRIREPYKIYNRTANGGFEMIIDEESRALKEKYS
jgi:hypothetical protein